MKYQKPKQLINCYVSLSRNEEEVTRLFKKNSWLLAKGMKCHKLNYDYVDSWLEQAITGLWDYKKYANHIERCLETLSIYSQEEYSKSKLKEEIKIEPDQFTEYYTIEGMEYDVDSLDYLPAFLKQDFIKLQQWFLDIYNSMLKELIPNLKYEDGIIFGILNYFTLILRNLYLILAHIDDLYKGLHKELEGCL